MKNETFKKLMDQLDNVRSGRKEYIKLYQELINLLRQRPPLTDTEMDLDPSAKCILPSWDRFSETRYAIREASDFIGDVVDGWADCATLLTTMHLHQDGKAATVTKAIDFWRCVERLLNNLHVVIGD